jgi:hypothetical protein
MKLAASRVLSVGSAKPVRSAGWWLMAGADLFLKKSTAGWLLVIGLF